MHKPGKTDFHLSEEATDVEVQMYDNEDQFELFDCSE